MDQSVIGVILAGGLSNRMGGGDKTLRLLNKKPMLKHVIDRLTPQVRSLLISANGDAQRFAQFDLPVLPDTIRDNLGPLAGILTGMEWIAQHQPSTKWMLSVSADTPFLPTTLVAQLMKAAIKEQTSLAVAYSRGFSHPVVALWSTSLASDLRHTLTAEHNYKVDSFTQRYPLSRVDFDNTPVDPFFNINTPDDLIEAQTLIAKHQLP